MGEILGLGLTHFPLLTKNDESMTAILHKMLSNPRLPEELRDPANWPAPMREEYSDDRGLAAAKQHRQAVVNELRQLKVKIDEFKPDFVVIWGDDQYENFKDDIIPAFCVGIYDEVTTYPWKAKDGELNIWGEPKDKGFTLQGHKAGGKALAKGLLEEGFDISYAYKPAHYDGVPHAFLNSVLFLDYDREGFDYPVIPFQVNCYGKHVISQQGGLPNFERPPLKEEDLDPPAPSAKRCMELGAATARVLKNSPYRVALIASSSWSHAFLTEKNHFLYPNVERDRELYEALVRGDFETWRNMTLDEIVEDGQQEILNWSCLLGAMEELGRKTPDQHGFVDSYILNSNKTFVAYNA